MLPAKEIDTIKDDILGKEYSLSVAYVSQKKSQEINKKYRKKDRPTNVLSFALTKQSGELLLCLPVVRREAPKIDKSFDEWLLFLFIHGMLHLKGMDHGEKMEKKENSFYKKYLSRTRF